MTIENNRISDSEERSGIIVAGYSYDGVEIEDVTIRNNIIFNNPGWFVDGKFKGYGDGIMIKAPSKNVYIYNNTVSHNGGSSINFDPDYYSGTINTVVIKNNILDSPINGNQINNDGNPTVSAENNLYWPSAKFSSSISDSNPIIGDPKFVNLNEGEEDFRLQADSPAIDSGPDVSYLYHPEEAITDADGKPRPIGSGWDIGAYEYQKDTQGPILQRVRAVNPTTLRLYFSETLDETSLTQAGYSISPYIPIELAGLSSSLKSIRLSTAEHQREKDYTIRVSGLKDLSENSMEETELSYKISPELELIELKPANYQVAYLKEGDNPYLEEDLSYTLKNLPEGLEDLLWIKTADADKDDDDLNVKFKVNQDVTVYVAYDARVNPPDWLINTTRYTPLKKQIKLKNKGTQGAISFNLYKDKINYKPDNNIKLYQNLPEGAQPDDRLMYLILLKPRGEGYEGEE